jgi:hypothetical protein
MSLPYKYAPVISWSRILTVLRFWRNASSWILSIGLTILLWLSSSPVLAQASDHGYQLGRGYKLGNTGIHLGGYGSARISGLGSEPWKLEISDLSLFVTWDNGSRLRFFSELEVEDTLTAGEHQGLTTKATYFALERLHLDYLINDALTIRIGKVLTPIGQWNVIHADPLVWTTTRPVATQNLFSKNLTGVTLHGNVAFGEQSIDYAVYGEYSDSLDPNPADKPHFDNAVGARIRYNVSDDLQIGLSYSDFALRGSSDIRQHLLGLDVAWTYQRYAVNSEIVYRNTDTKINANAWQGYVQGVSPLAGHFYAVARYEFFDQDNGNSGHDNGKLGQVGVLGLAYRPSPPSIWKLEYRVGTHNKDLAPDGLFASFSVLF